MHGSRILVFVVAWWHGPFLVNFLVFSPLELLKNGTNHDAKVHIPKVPLSPFDDKEDAGTISTFEIDAVFIICLKTIYMVESMSFCIYIHVLKLLTCN